MKAPEAKVAQKYAWAEQEQDDSSSSDGSSDGSGGGGGADSWRLMLDASLGVHDESPAFYHSHLGHAWKVALHWQKTLVYRFDELMHDWRYKYIMLVCGIAGICFVLTGFLRLMVQMDCAAYDAARDDDDAANAEDGADGADGTGLIMDDPFSVYCGDKDVLGAATLAWMAYTMVMDVASHLQIQPGMMYTRIVGIAGTFFGVLMFSIVTGVMVDKVSRFLLAVDQGMSPVVERNHHVILGWTSKGPFLLDELCRSMESEGGGTIAILSPMQKMELQKTLAELQEPGVRPFRGSTVVIRQGDPFNVNDLRRVAAPFAKTICILASPNAATDVNRSDMSVMRTVLAIKSMGQRESLVIIPELKDYDNVHLINITGGKVVEPVVGHDVIAHLLVKAVKIPFLGAVYGSLLGFDGSEFYFYEMPRWQATKRLNFKDLMYCSPDTILIGIRDKHGKVTINPDDSVIPEPTDELVVIAEDDSLITFQSQPMITDEGRNVAREIPRRDWTAPPSDHILVCGWRRGIEDLLMGLDRSCRKGSTVTILSTKSLEERLELFGAAGFDESTDIQNVELIHAVGDSRVKRHLLLLHNNNEEQIVPDPTQPGKPLVVERDKSFEQPLTGPLLDQMNRILIVANEDLEATGAQTGRGLHSDSQCISTLIVIREIQKKPRVIESLRNSKVDRRVLLKRGSCGFDFEKFGQSLPTNQSGEGTPPERAHIVCEVLDSNTQKVVTQSRALENAADWCVSNDLVAKLLAMVMENRELASLIQELVGHEGQQLYVHPASRYVRAGEKLRFWDVMLRVRVGGEIALGYITSNAHEHGGSGGGPSIIINPVDKAEVLRLRPTIDFIVTVGYNTDVFSSTGVQVGKGGLAPSASSNSSSSSGGSGSPSKEGAGNNEMRSGSSSSPPAVGNSFTRKAAERMTSASERMKMASDSALTVPGFEFDGLESNKEEGGQ